MKLVVSQNKRVLIVVFISLIVVFEMIAYVATTPRPSEQFFQLYVLGSNGMAANYYPANNPDISPNETITWYLGATDFMGNVQFVDIRVKLGNQTINPPDDQLGLPSPSPLITEFQHFTQNNETWQFPFAWRVTNAELVNNRMRILTLEINNETYQVADWSARSGYNFRLIFELWTWDTNTGAPQFGWQTNGERRVAWLQIWFNMTASAPSQYA
jgi:uncharacterized membrane protein